MIDKKQVLGGLAAAAALLGVSVATGKIDISKLTGGGDAQLSFERKLPPPVSDKGEVMPGGASGAGAESPPAVQPDVAATPADDVLAQVAGEASPDPFVAELLGEPAASKTTEAPAPVAPASTSSSSQPTLVPVAQLAATDPARFTVGSASFTAPPVVPSGQVPPAPPPAGAASVPPASLPASPPGPPAPAVSGAPQNLTAAAAIVPSAGVLAPGQGAVSVPGAHAPSSTPLMVSAASKRTVSMSGSAPTMPTDLSPVPAAAFTSGSAMATGSLASLPTNATGKDLLELQTQLAVLEKQKAIASGQEAIAESNLKTRKALYEITQIGQPTAEERAAIAQVQAQAQVQAAAQLPPPPPSPIAMMRLVSTTRANGVASATLSLNGKLIDVKKGSIVAGFLVDKVSDNSVHLIGEGETKTVWID